jgi:20S proteasome subunit alpha 1
LPLASLWRSYTQSASMRPLACTAIIAAVDDEKGPQIFKVDPAGHFLPFFATASGAKEAEATNYFEKKVSEMKDYDVDATARCAIMCLGSVLGSDFKGSEIEVAVVQGSGKFVKLTEDDIEAHLNAIAEIDA